MSGDEEKEFVVKFEPPKYSTLESGIYKAELIGIHKSVGIADQPIYILIFEIIEGIHAHQILNGRINQNGKRVGGKIWQLVYALTGKKPSEKDSLNLLMLVGMHCFINVEQKGRNNAITEYICEAEFSDIKPSN